MSLQDRVRFIDKTVEYLRVHKNKVDKAGWDSLAESLTVHVNFIIERHSPNQLEAVLRVLKSELAFESGVRHLFDKYLPHNTLDITIH